MRRANGHPASSHVWRIFVVTLKKKKYFLWNKYF